MRLFDYGIQEYTAARRRILLNAFAEKLAQANARS